MSGTGGAGHKHERGGGRMSRMAERSSVHGTADRMLSERAPDRKRLWRMPTFWVIMLVAFIALLLMLLTSCGRMVSPDTSPSPSAATAAAEDPGGQSGAVSPTGTAAEESPSPSASMSETASPEPSNTAPAGQSLKNWPVPKGMVTDTGLKYGYADKTGQFVIPPTFKHVRPFTAQGLAVVDNDADNSAVIDRTGQLVIPWKPASIQLADTGPVLVSIYADADARNGTEVFDAEGNLLYATGGYLSLYSEGLAVLHDEGPDGYGPVGYVDERGTVKFYTMAADLRSFVDGLALVAESYGGPQHYIDVTGKDVTATVSSGLAVYQDPETNRFGYRRSDGTLLTDAVYLEAEPFRDGTAIVSANPDMNEYVGLYGLLDTSGKWVMAPMYSGIRRMRNSLFLVGEPLRAPGWYGYVPYMDYTDMALFDASGTMLVDFVLTVAQDANAAYVSVSDGSKIWFVDNKGKPVQDIAEISGAGSFRIVGDLLFGTVDGFECVYRPDGTAVAVLRETTDLGDGLVLSSKRAGGNRYENLMYPVLEGVPGLTIKKRINDRIREVMGSAITMEPELDEETGIRYIETLEGGWQGWRVGDVLVVEQYPYWYPLGANHGSPGMKTLHFDLTTGHEIKMTALLRDDQLAGALRFLSDQVTSAIVKDMEEVGYFVDHVDVAADQPFRLTRDGLILYWSPYELASYAAYFREFLIPWEDLAPYADRAGAAWTALRLP